MKGLFLRYWTALQAPDPAVGMHPARFWTMMFFIGLIAIGVAIFRSTG